MRVSVDRRVYEIDLVSGPPLLDFSVLSPLPS